MVLDDDTMYDIGEIIQEYVDNLHDYGEIYKFEDLVYYIADRTEYSFEELVEQKRFIKDKFRSLL